MPTSSAAANLATAALPLCCPCFSGQAPVHGKAPDSRVQGLACKRRQTANPIVKTGLAFGEGILEGYGPSQASGANHSCPGTLRKINIAMNSTPTIPTEIINPCSLT